MRKTIKIRRQQSTRVTKPGESVNHRPSEISTWTKQVGQNCNQNLFGYNFSELSDIFFFNQFIWQNIIIDSVFFSLEAVATDMHVIAGLAFVLGKIATQLKSPCRREKLSTAAQQAFRISCAWIKVIAICVCLEVIEKDECNYNMLGTSDVICFSQLMSPKEGSNVCLSVLRPISSTPA